MRIIYITLPRALFQLFIYALVGRKYRLSVQQKHHIPLEGGVLLLGNHVSWIDWAIISMATNRRVHFVMERELFERWEFRWFLNIFEIIPIRSQSHDESKKEVISRLNHGGTVCVFPEGSLSKNSNLGEFNPWFESIAQETKTTIIPFYIRGLWGSRFSLASGKVRFNTSSHYKRDVVVAFGAPMGSTSSTDEVKKAVFTLSFSAWKEYAQTLKPLHNSWLAMAKRLGGNLSVADSTGANLSNIRFITGTLLFSKAIKQRSPEKYIGLMLPTTAGGMLANMATLVNGQVACNLNYTAGEQAIRAAIKKAGIKTVYTAHAFVEKLKDRGLDVAALGDSVSLYYLEDIKQTFSKPASLSMLLQAKFLPTMVLEKMYLTSCDVNDTAVILFSSGSEGTPKGVELTHKNFMVNLKQATDLLNTRDDDLMMGILPLFHAMGLMANCFLPLIEGMPVMCHPDPTDAEMVGKSVAKYKATILVGSSTFLRIYNRNKKCTPLMFDSLHLVIAGAEKLSLDVRKEFKEKFGHTIYEGYGVTECSPVTGLNIHDYLDTQTWEVQESLRVGTVGLPIPGTAYKIVDPDTQEELASYEDGLILVGGEQVMKGYLKDPEKTAEVISERDGLRWYATGDKGHLDKDGFLTIVDRYSRFAKLGGEMVSLGKLENDIREALTGHEIDLIATALPDAKKGEQVVLLITGDLTAQELRKKIVEAKINPLSIPAKILEVSAIPKLGSGKNDFPGTKKLAQELLHG